MKEVLVVEDDIMNLKLIWEILKAEGYTVHYAMNGVEAIDMGGDKERFLAAGLDDYIPKPIDVSEFIKKVKNIVLMTNEAG